ncbi:FAD-dependent oxidoreductase [Streptomyces sp. NPDC001970]
MDRVVVIGAGVVGLTTAVCLAEAGLDVQVDTDRTPDMTTSAAAGAMWDPYLVSAGSATDRWSRVTLSALTELSFEPDTGIHIVEGTQESRAPRDLPSWWQLVDAHPCSADELRPGFLAGWRYQAPVVAMHRYLDYLTQRLARAGGRIRHHHYTSLDEAATGAVRVVINCSGMGARALAADLAVEPVRGQLVVVENPGIESFFCDDTPGAELLTYIYPHTNTVVLGGTAERGSWSLQPDLAAAQEIIERCAAVEPSLADARVLDHRVGLRPTRSEVRLSEEWHNDTLILHNYGHGGAGVTLSWGCAREAVERVQQATGITP